MVERDYANTNSKLMKSWRFYLRETLTNSRGTDIKTQKLEFQKRLKGAYAGLCALVINTALGQCWQLFLFFESFFSALVSLLSLGSLLVILRAVFGRTAEGTGDHCWHVCRPHCEVSIAWPLVCPYRAPQPSLELQPSKRTQYVSVCE